MSNVNGQDSGMVQIFHREENALDWVKRGQSIVGDKAEDFMGLAVVLSSDGLTLAVGAAGSSGDSYASGQVQIYNFDEDESKWKRRQALYGDESFDQLGVSLSMSGNGDTLAVGAPWSDQQGTDTGFVKVFQEKEESNWSSLGQAIYGDIAGVQFGGSVSISSDASTLAAGAAFHDNNGQDSGRVFVYRWDKSVSRWEERGQAISGETAETYFGRSISLSADGTTLAIGANGNDANGASSGTVEVYGWVDNQSRWEQLGPDINGEAPGDNSGWSVSLSGDGKILAVGSPWNSGNGEKSGCVRVYVWDEDISRYEKLASDIIGDAAGDDFGHVVVLSQDGSTLAIGAELHDGNGITDSGQVKLFRIEH